MAISGCILRILYAERDFLVLRLSRTQVIYGATFIDYEQKYVFNSSRLGKEFSANVFNDLFNFNGKDKGQKPEKPFFQI
jgi:hypothetical protein